MAGRLNYHPTTTAPPRQLGRSPFGEGPSHARPTRDDPAIIGQLGCQIAQRRFAFLRGALWPLEPRFAAN